MMNAQRFAQKSSGTIQEAQNRTRKTKPVNRRAALLICLAEPAETSDSPAIKK